MRIDSGPPVCKFGIQAYVQQDACLAAPFGDDLWKW